MKILSLNNVLSSSISYVNEKIVLELSQKQKAVGMIALVVFVCLATVGIYVGRVYYKARSLGQSANKLLKEKKLDDAAKKFEEALTYRPSHVFNLIHYGKTLRAQKNYGKCSVQYMKVLEIEPKNIKVMMKYADALLLGHNFEEAVEQFNRALEVNAGKDQSMEAIILWRLGYVFYRQQNTLEVTFNRDTPNQQKLEEAEKYLTKSLAISKDSPEVLKLYGQVLLLQKKYGNAEEQFEKYLKLKPEDHHAWLSYSEVLEKLDKEEESKAAHAKGIPHLFPRDMPDDIIPNYAPR